MPPSRDPSNLALVGATPVPTTMKGSCHAQGHDGSRYECAPERIRAALLDFSPDRPALWPGIEPTLYQVYSVGGTSALVKEGSRLAREGGLGGGGEDYDWSDPTTVTWTVRESNFCAPGSSVSATIEPRAGGSRVRIVWNRTATSFLGRLMIGLIVATGGKPVAASFEKGMKVLERVSASTTACHPALSALLEGGRELGGGVAADPDVEGGGVGDPVADGRVPVPPLVRARPGTTPVRDSPAARVTRWKPLSSRTGRDAVP